MSGRNGDGRAGGEAKVTEEEGEGLDEPTGRPSSSIGHAWPRSTRCSPPRDWLPGSGEGNKGGVSVSMCGETTIEQDRLQK